MFSRILIKLVDQAILPAILLLAARVVSIILISKNQGLAYEVNGSGVLFSNVSDYILVNSYSIFIMGLVLLLGLSLVLFKSFVFHDTHITPGLSAKMFSLNIPSFIQNSFELYSQGIVWVSYLYLLLIVSAIMSVFGLLYSWVFYVTLFTAILSTVLFIMDIEREIEIAKNKEPIYDNHADYLSREQNDE